MIKALTIKNTQYIDFISFLHVVSGNTIQPAAGRRGLLVPAVKCKLQEDVHIVQDVRSCPWSSEMNFKLVREVTLLTVQVGKFYQDFRIGFRY